MKKEERRETTLEELEELAGDIEDEIRTTSNEEKREEMKAQLKIIDKAYNIFSDYRGEL